MKKIIMEALYGEYSNLYGDRGNLLYVQEKLRRAGVEFELIQTHLFDRPAFAERAVDLYTSAPAPRASRSRSWPICGPMPMPCASGWKGTA